ncbi:hypothetical protein EUGRSUZ_B01162 [Eucalyptus grandis]|uniref:Uncharacterized protein n=2 Tax=Eucalyptus grandis TaxID=71139 RepID=A0ACC3LPE5_EUCGR|nr:hypothetical protein EUGRSUZ_B01162 [Eucalyptus grandis]
MEQLISFIIRPPRAEYSPKYDLLDDEFMLKDKLYRRNDLEVKNSRGEIIQCTHYVPVVSPEGKPLPCVIYCHGNSGCRADASEAAIVLLPSNITVFTLDFSGSGLSGGEHVTLGWNEKDDLKAVVEYLRADGNVSLIGLWGRSMGAVTSLMYGADDPSIAGMVLDSPFSDLVDLMMELADTHAFRLPKFTVKLAVQYMRRAIQKKAKFDIVDLNTIKVAKSCFVPVLLGHANEDDFIRPHHADRIFEAYMGDKNIIKFEGDHNSPRPQFYFDSINIFFHNVLQPPEDEVAGPYFEPMLDYLGKGDWSGAHQVSRAHEPSSVAQGSDASTADAIRQLRTRRPMSRMEVPSDIPEADHHSMTEDAKVEEDPHSSSSKMINFELSNGHPYGPHVPAALEDDEYVEYQLDDPTGFPCTVEEEEKMLMEAVMMSLKDLEMRHYSENDPVPDTSTESFGSSQKDGQATSSTTELSEASKTDSTPASEINGHIQMFDAFTDTNTPSSSPSCDNPPSATQSDTNSLSKSPLENAQRAEVGVEKASSVGTEGPTSIQSPLDTDMSGNTRATLTVVRNPSNNIMDGFMRRWDFGLFRNNR